MVCSMGDQSMLGHKQHPHGGKQSLEVSYDGLRTHEKSILKTRSQAQEHGSRALRKTFFIILRDWLIKKERLGQSMEAQKGRRISPFGHGPIRPCPLTQLRKEVETSLWKIFLNCEGSFPKQENILTLNFSSQNSNQIQGKSPLNPKDPLWPILIFQKEEPNLKH